MVICSSLCAESSCFVIARVSVIGILTYKSLMSKVIILWCSFIFICQVIGQGYGVFDFVVVLQVQVFVSFVH